MTYTLQNDRLTVQIAQRGAELLSVTAHDGCQYLWQGDPRYWGDRAPWLFPVCGRMFEGCYTYRNNTYDMQIHGFVRHCLFRAEAATSDTLVLSFTANEETRTVFPFDFTFTVTYRLSESQLMVDLSVTNHSAATLPFSMGAHPGFCAPINGKGAFEDCYLEFDCSHIPNKLLFTERLLLSGERIPYPLREGRFIDLTRDFFAEDATFLAETCGAVTLHSRQDPHFVRVEYPAFAYVGFWTRCYAGADYVCIEPWSGLPSLDGAVEDLETKPDMYHLPSGEQKNLALKLIFG